MNLRDYTFVALDLETTGLSPEKDTIIEVAAVKFHLIREWDTFDMVDTEERSMLIHPGRAMTEEISMITGITDAMLEGKPSWESVCERVRDFIGDDSIIVGHNVLFDIAMFATHGINLSSHIALDTFELSEIFSRDAESLNLWFLGKKYQIPIESEHRALDDTKLSAALFRHYLKEIIHMNDSSLRLWHHAMIRDTHKIYATLLDITGMQKTYEEKYILPFLWVPESTKKTVASIQRYTWDYTLMSLSGSQEEELNIITSHRKNNDPILIITPEKKTAHYQKSVLEMAGYKTCIMEDVSRFCSISMLSYWLDMPSWWRKESIFIVKLISWLHVTKTGLLDELKYYGEERSLIELFRAEEEEYNIFVEQQKENTKDIDIFLSDIYFAARQKKSIIEGPHTLIMRDIVFMEDAMRRARSHSLSFTDIFQRITELSRVREGIFWQDMIVGVSIIREIYETVPQRPVWDSPLPPGDFWETYFIKQSDLWHRGYIWLMLAKQKLEQSVSHLLDIPDLNPIEKKYQKHLMKDLNALIHMAWEKDINTSIIITLTVLDTKIAYIPRDIQKDIHTMLSYQWWENTLMLWYGIESDDIKKFLSKECGLDGKVSAPEWIKKLNLRNSLHIHEQKTVILTTSTKHIRLMMQELTRKYPHAEIYGQWISGWKGKMMSLFERAKNQSILIGIIDNWIDESFLWKSVDMVIIAKIPFDPPTDPYFLARTVGMKNNFEEYSTPIALATINTLVWRIYSIHPNIEIYTIDDRIQTTNWWQSMKYKFL